MGWDDQMWGIQTTDQGPRTFWRGCIMIRLEVLKQLTKFTYALETDEEDGMG